MRRGKYASKQTSKMLTEHVKAAWSCCCVSAHAHVAAAPFAVSKHMQSAPWRQGSPLQHVGYGRLGLFRDREGGAWLGLHHHSCV
jgi:hypothetical protein